MWFKVIPMVALAALAASAEDSGLVPIQQLAGGQLKITGFAQAIFDVGNAQANTEFDLPVARVKGIYERGSMKLGSEINFAELDEKDSNWLRELWVGYKFSDQLELRAGRVFTASGFATPPQFLVKTIQYPKAAFYSCYGWGAQLNYLTKEWQARLDVTDGSGTSFPEEKDKRVLTCSGHVRRNFEQGYLGATGQWSEDFWRLGLDTEVRPVKSLTLRGLACYESKNDEKISDRVGLYLLAAYRPTKADWFELHAQADFVRRLAKCWEEYQTSKADDGTISVKRVGMESDGSSDSVITIGTRFFLGEDDCLSLTVDCQIPLDDEDAVKDPKVLGRLQFKF